MKINLSNEKQDTAKKDIRVKVQATPACYQDIVSMRIGARSSAFRPKPNK